MKKKQKDTKKKPFWKNLLITKKIVEQDPNDKDIQWVTLDLYNSYEDVDISNKKELIDVEKEINSITEDIENKNKD